MPLPSLLHRQLGLSYSKCVALKQNFMKNNVIARRIATNNGGESANASEMTKSFLQEDEKSQVIDETKPVTKEHIKEVLMENNIALANVNTYACYQATCPRIATLKFSEWKDSDTQLFINKSTGYFECRKCKKSGPFGLLKENLEQLRALKMEKKELGKECFQKIRLPVKREAPKISEYIKSCVSVESLSDKDLTSLLKHIDLEEINRATLEHFGALIDEEKHALVLPCYRDLDDQQCVSAYTTISSEPYEFRGEPRESRTRVKFTDGKNSKTLFGLRELIANEEADHFVFVEDARDAMAIYQSTGVPALAKPKRRAFPQEILPHLERFHKVTIWPKDDTRDVQDYSRKLCERRCFIVRRTKKSSGPFQALRQGENLRSVLRNSKAAKSSYIVSFSDLREELYSDMTNADVLAGVKWTRFPKLNEVLKGHRRGELTVFTGPTGAGKTTFISEYSLDLCINGVNTLWGSFEINNKKLMRTMLRQFSGINIEEKMENFERVGDLFEQLNMYFMTFHGQERIDRVIETMDHAMYVKDISHVIVDNLQFMMGTENPYSSQNRFLVQDSVIAAFRKFATVKDCHVTLVVHPRKEKPEDPLTLQSIFGSAKAAQEADNIIILQKRPLPNGSFKKYIEVVKNRYAGDLGMMPLKFDKESLSFSQMLKNKIDSDDEIGNADSSVDSSPYE